MLQNYVILQNQQQFKKMSLRHFTIPIFIPMQACPFRCIYCDQVRISGHWDVPDSDEVKNTITKYLKTININESIVEVGFFGGTFTGLKLQEQENYLKAIQPFINEGKVKSIRLSTRPDFINQQVIDLLKKNNVGTIELGAQSMDDEVLRKTGRGHTAADVVAAAQMIRSNSMRLGLQMMIGLPGDSKCKAMMTAQRFADLGADDVRIYPTLVIRGTPLERLFHNGKYIPLTLTDAVEIAADLLIFFENHSINVIRVGLHPSDGLLSGESLVAGPFHVSFRELVRTKIWEQLFQPFITAKPASKITFHVPSGELNAAIGYRSVNRKMLATNFHKVVFKSSDKLKGREFYVDYH